MPDQKQIQHDLITEGVFNAELSGYAASAAAAELIHHWEDQGAEVVDKWDDIRDTIDALQRWMRTL